MTTANEILDYNETTLETEGTRKGEGPQARAASGGTFTGNGRIAVTHRDSRITALSNVTAGISEVNANNVPFLGDAVMTVHNVAPFNGGVIVRVNVAWNSPLRCKLMVTFE